MMKSAVPAPNADAYVSALSGWRRELVSSLRAAVASAGSMEERIKWGHLVYLSNGPACLIRAEDERVLFGFWRGKQLRDIEPRLKPGGKYEMATLELHQGDRISAAQATRLAKEAIALNARLGDPTDLGK
jgi:hypothetical protein